MRILLDSHALLWYAEDSPRLSKKSVAAIEGDDNLVFVSVASVWELTIKTVLGKLTPKKPIKTMIDDFRAMGAVILPITEIHAMAIGDLPNVHRDPFDRLLVAQARCEGLTIVTDDGFIPQYPVACLW